MSDPLNLFGYFLDRIDGIKRIFYHEEMKEHEGEIQIVKR